MGSTEQQRLSPVKAADLHLTLDSSSFVPYYEQLVEQIRGLVKRGRLSEGSVFCSEGELARALNISKMPVRQAFQKLRSEGLLTIERGKRPVIGSGRMPWNFQQLRGFSEEMRRRGLSVSARIIELKIEQPNSEVAQALKLSSNEKIYRIKRVRSINSGPVALVTSHLPARIFAGIEHQDLEHQSLYHVFEEVFHRKLKWAEEVFGAVVAGEEEASVLETSIGSPLLNIHETTYDVKQIPIEYSISLLRGDRYTASVISIRK